jgi:pyrimidine-specific ribonucleoside hydrolase
MVVFSNFPIQLENYSVDIQMIMMDTIEKYGFEEWKLLSLTSEMHGHLGVYAIIGAKMGLFAMDTLHARHDEVSIVSFAGYKPPVSCLNDGLQVSTGATFGHGLISVCEAGTARPIADFSLRRKTIRLTLKKVFNKEIDGSIKEAISSSDGLTDEYWHIIRKLAIKCWSEYNRNEIFEIKETKR